MTVKEMNERMRELGYSYEQIAKLSGVSESTVRKVLGGITQAPRYATLQALAKAFKVNNSRNVSIKHQIGSDTLCVAERAPAHGLPKKQGDYTLEDYLALPDERRAELIDGVIYDMSAPTGYHQLITGELYSMLRSRISEKGGDCRPFVSPIDVQLDCDDRTIVQPDVLILCDKSKYTPARIVGAPDFVAEILSKSTRSKDMYTKLYKYRNAGVREYWMIDPDKKRIIVWQFEKDDYGIYGFRDSIPVGIYDGEIVIDFSVIDDYIDGWM